MNKKTNQLYDYIALLDPLFHESFFITDNKLLKKNSINDNKKHSWFKNFLAKKGFFSKSAPSN
ncbi:hypothetical protein [Rickettsiales endosymbiont of Stachyamoeba lipophora]|uniref:hypothetical protein n=1 Tax=Rickettsiales endosymbiont of Stachyamoeba lipophora TaxID=2486578 RepID=UPI000F64EF8B|nr:hypothetical protein [Rickettsiales endosymbiont of Stachyamoeba lipophora]AZL15843.1 hypothetical protein EF513_04700 [Rickettsiales endosymbiont of Stachyamoeba lipophora]